MKLDGRIAVVTGAGSRMGRAMAREFYEQGANVVAVDLWGPAAEETIALLKDPDRSLALTADVSRLADVEATVAAATSRFGRIDLLCNSAGVARRLHAGGPDLGRAVAARARRQPDRAFYFARGPWCRG